MAFRCFRCTKSPYPTMRLEAIRGHRPVRSRPYTPPAPAKAVAHVVEDALLAAAQVVELHDVHCQGPEVVGEYAAVGVLALPEVGLSVNAPLPLDDEAVGLALPFLHEDGVGAEVRSVGWSDR